MNFLVYQSKMGYLNQRPKVLLQGMVLAKQSSCQDQADNCSAGRADTCRNIPYSFLVKRSNG